MVIRPQIHMTLFYGIEVVEAMSELVKCIHFTMLFIDDAPVQNPIPAEDQDEDQDGQVVVIFEIWKFGKHVWI